MKRNFDSRLNRLEQVTNDWAARLDCVDYLGLCDYNDGNWIDLHHEGHITVLRNQETNEIRGVYEDRRGNAEIVAQGGKLQYL